jgi:hypothetical protein
VRESELPPTYADRNGVFLPQHRYVKGEDKPRARDRQRVLGIDRLTRIGRTK